MKLAWTSSIIAVGLVLACGPQSAESGDESETGTPPVATNSDSTDGEPVTSTTQDPPETTTATDGPVVTTDPTEEPPVTTTATDGEVVTTDPTDITGPDETDTSDTDGPLECGEKDPAVDATFKVVLAAWPGQSDEGHDIDSVCVVDAVGVEGGVVTTDVTCDVDGVMLGASFQIAAAPEGQVDWEAGQSVALRSRFSQDDFGKDVALHVTLAGDPDALLVDGRDWWGGDVPMSQQIGPILRERLENCLPDSEDSHFELRYSLESGSSLVMASGRRGSLAIDDAHIFAVDLDHSGVIQFHGSEHSLIRRIQSEG